MDEALLEADVLLVAEPAIGLERRRVVGADVEDHLVAGPQEVGGHRAGRRGREAATAVVDVGQDVADDGQPRLVADDVRPGGGHEPAADAHPVVDPVGDRRRRQPRGEAELVEPVEVADLDRQEPADLGRVRPERRPVDPHPDHLRTRVDPVRAGDRRERARTARRRTPRAAG